MGIQQFLLFSPTLRGKSLIRSPVQVFIYRLRISGYTSHVEIYRNLVMDLVLALASLRESFRVVNYGDLKKRFRRAAWVVTCGGVFFVNKKQQMHKWEFWYHFIFQTDVYDPFNALHVHFRSLCLVAFCPLFCCVTFLLWESKGPTPQCHVSPN